MFPVKILPKLWELSHNQCNEVITDKVAFECKCAAFACKDRENILIRLVRNREKHSTSSVLLSNSTREEHLSYQSLFLKGVQSDVFSFAYEEIKWIPTRFPWNTPRFSSRLSRNFSRDTPRITPPFSCKIMFGVYLKYAIKSTMRFC